MTGLLPLLTLAVLSGAAASTHASTPASDPAAGPATAGVIGHIMANRPHPQQGFRSGLGILRLGERYGHDRLEAACARALRLNACRYQSIASILQRGLDRQALPEQHSLELPATHDHLRGPGYFH